MTKTNERKSIERKEEFITVRPDDGYQSRQTEGGPVAKKSITSCGLQSVPPAQM